MAQKKDSLDFSTLFKLDKLINLNIISYSFYEVGLKKFVALASDKELIFLYIDPQDQRTEKKYNWNFVENPIYGMCFEPTGTWTLVISEQKILLVPFLPLFSSQNSQNTFDCKWSTNETTCIFLETAIKPKSVVWWLTKESENILIIGLQSGSLIFYSLDTHNVVGESKVPYDIKDLQISFDDSLDVLTLLITGINSQWKLILEHRSHNYNWLHQICIAQAEKDKKEGFMSYIKQLSKDKITLFAHGSHKDGNKSQAVEYTNKPTEYLPAFRKGLNKWTLTAQYCNGHHFLTAFDVTDGTLILESTEEAAPSRTFQPNITINLLYQQGLWSQRLIYLLGKNVVEVHSSSFSMVQSDNMQCANKDNTLLWSAELVGDVQRAFLMSTREPPTPASGWREPTFLCDLQLPRFNLEPCLIVTNRGLYLLHTVCCGCEWVVGAVVRGGRGAERAARALGAAVPMLLRAAADVLLARGKLPVAQYLYSVSKYPQDGWLARLGVFNKLPELCEYKETDNDQQPSISNTARTVKILAQILKICTDQEALKLDRKLAYFNTIQLEEMCCFSAALGLWDIVPIFSIQRGQPDLLMTAIKSRDDICRGALNCLLRCKDLISVLEEDKSFLFNFIMSNCEKFDLKLLRRLCIWLCPLQDQFRSVLRDLRQGISTIYTNRMLEMTDTFMHIVTSLDAKDPCQDISVELPDHTETWKGQLSPRRSVSCGFAHWAIADGGNAKVVFANTPINCDLIGRVISVACGRHHTLILTENGVYSSGDNTYGQLGVGRAWPGADDADGAAAGGRVHFVKRVWPAPPASLAAGHYHSALVDLGGRLYTWGWGVHGQLGLGGIDDEWSPRLVTKLQGRKVLQVACGAFHTAALSGGGDVWCWGSGMMGQLGGGGGGGGGEHKTGRPVRVSLPAPARSLAVGYFHTLALAGDRLWSWGASPHQVRAAYHRRHSDLASPSPTPTPTPSPPTPEPRPHMTPAVVDTDHIAGRIVQIAAGCHHSCILTDTGNIYTWGLNFDGQLGTGNKEKMYIPTEIKLRTDTPTEANIDTVSPSGFKQFMSSKSSNAKTPDEDSTEYTTKAIIACGGDYTIYVDDDGKIFITGNTQQQAISDPGKSGNKVIMMKTTKRVIKIPASKRHNKLMFQYFDRIDNMLETTSNNIQRMPIEPCFNPVTRLADFKLKSWPDQVIMLLKPWIKKETLSTNFNIAAKLAYHNQNYADYFKYSLHSLNQSNYPDILYLKHTDTKIKFNTESSNDIKSLIKKEEINTKITKIIATRIKEISMSILNEEPYPVIQPNVFKNLPCCCDELKHLPNGLLTYDDNSIKTVPSDLAAEAAKVIDKCLSMFPVNCDLWETCFRVAKDFYLHNKLPLNDLEIILQKYMNGNANVMASALMFTNDCTRYVEILSPNFFLNMCSELLDNWR